MSAYPELPDTLHWNAQALADAVPLRLFQLVAFQATALDADADADAGHAANGTTRPPRPRALRGGYRAVAPLAALFRIHH